MSASNVAAELVVREASPEVHAVAVSPPAAQSLAPWSVGLEDGLIVVDGTAVHPIVARDLWLRLGALLGQAERDSEHAEWDRLSAELDRHFRHAAPASGRTLGRPSMDVHGVLLREQESVAALRIATFSIAVLRPKKRGWEGPVYSLRPTQTGHERRPIGTWVRVPTEAVGAVATLALTGPVAPAAPRAARPAAVPRAPEWLREKWTDIRQLHTLILEHVPAVGDRLTFEQIASALRIPRDELRGHLQTLVEQGELVEDARLGAPCWTRVERPRGKDAARKGRRGKTKLAKAKPAAKAAKARATKKVEKPAAPAPPIALECRACNRVAHVPAGTVLPANPRCRTCQGPLRRLA